MMEDRSTTVLRDDLQKLFECPVCVQVFRNPKLLPCGHSVCAECCAQLNRDRVSLLCPVCRRPSTTLADRLPINFGLRDLVNHYVDSDDKKKFSCANCDRKVTENDCWSCDDCNKIICSFCAIKLHTLHTLKEIKDLLRDKETEINKWREDVSQIGKQVQSLRQQIDANEPRMKTSLRLLTSTVTKKLMPQLENDRRKLISELSNIQARCDSVNAVRLIMDDSKVRQDFNSLKSEQQIFLEKQRKLLERQTEVVSALRRCEATLTSYISNAPAIVDNTITFSTFLGRNNASPIHHEDMSVDVDWISSSVGHNNRRRPCDENPRLRVTTNTSRNEEQSPTVRLRRTRPSSDNRHRFFPDLLNQGNENENANRNLQQANTNHPSMFSSDEDILLASQPPQSYFTRNNGTFRATAPRSQFHMFMCDRATHNNPNNHITDESDIEEDINDSSNRENLAASTNNPVVTAFCSRPKNLTTPLNRLFSQIERRMNNDLDDHHSDLDSNLVEMDRDAQLNDLSDEITILPTSSSSVLNRASMDTDLPSTSSANQTQNVGLKNGSNVHKRSISQSDSSEEDLIEGEDDNEEEIDSAIRFRILRKR